MITSNLVCQRVTSSIVGRLQTLARDPDIAASHPWIPRTNPDTIQSHNALCTDELPVYLQPCYTECVVVWVLDLGCLRVWVLNHSNTRVYASLRWGFSVKPWPSLG